MFGREWKMYTIKSATKFFFYQKHYVTKDIKYDLRTAPVFNI